jgi:hypothetical protein
MGIDIRGWVEVLWTREDVNSEWRGVLYVPNLVERNGGLFAAFFGVSNEDHAFSPLFAERGLPDDQSNEVHGSALEDSVTPLASWALWSELEHVDWTLQAQEEDTIGCAWGSEWERMRADPRYDILAESSEKEMLGPSAWRLGRIQRHRRDAPMDEIETLTLEEYHDGKPIVYREARWRIAELMSVGWQTLFEIMPLLAKQYGAANVRLVVWFV